MVLDNRFDVLGMVLAQLIVANGKSDDPCVGSQTAHDGLEVSLQLIARQVEPLQVLVAGDDLPSEDSSRLTAHTLVFET